MEKVLVEVFVPVIGTAYDVLIPLKSGMAEVAQLLKKAVTELSNGHFVATEDTTVCYRENGTIININMSVYELGIRNGSKLMLI